MDTAHKLKPEENISFQFLPMICRALAPSQVVSRISSINSSALFGYSSIMTPDSAVIELEI